MVFWVIRLVEGGGSVSPPFVIFDITGPISKIQTPFE